MSRQKANFTAIKEARHHECTPHSKSALTVERTIERRRAGGGAALTSAGRVLAGSSISQPHLPLPLLLAAAGPRGATGRPPCIGSGSSILQAAIGRRATPGPSFRSDMQMHFAGGACNAPVRNAPAAAPTRCLPNRCLPTRLRPGPRAHLAPHTLRSQGHMKLLIRVAALQIEFAETRGRARLKARPV